MRKKFISFMLIASSVFAYTQTGTLDSSFNGNGIVIGNYTSGKNSADAMVIQPDGKIVVAGATGNYPNINVGLSRYNTNGQIDTTFGVNGKMNFTSGWTKSYIYDMHLQPDGKIVVGGYRYNDSEGDFLLARINSDGTLDNTFGSNGVATFDNVGSEVAESFEILPDGSFIISGYTDDHFLMLKVKSNGTIDSTFGNSGWVSGQFETVSSYSKDTSVGPNGRIVLAGFGMDAFENKAKFVVMAYHPDGSPDNSFGTDGKMEFHVGNDNDFGIRVLQLNDGKILVGGHSYFGKWPLRYELAVIKLNADGSIDNSFGENGIFKTRFKEEGENYLSDMTLQTDGKILLTGAAREGSVNDYGIARLTQDGQLDTSFGEGGKTVTHMDSYYTVSYNVGTQDDGKIVVSGDAVPVGNGNAQFFIARYLSPALAVENTQATSLKLYPNPASDYIVLEWKGTAEEYSADIFSITGQKVISSKITNKKPIDISGLTKGNYMIRLKGSEQQKTLHFIKK